MPDKHQVKVGRQTALRIHNIAADPTELTNLAGTPVEDAPRFHELRERLLAWRAATPWLGMGDR